jgi:N-acetylglutamate synthase-like GNAT family acetyltransferase
MSRVAVVVRTARPADAEAIQHLYRILTPNPAICVLPERIAQVCADQNTELLAAEHEQVVQGTALLTLCIDVMFKEQPFAVVENIVVAPEYRGKGIGSALLARIESIALQRNCSKVMLLSSAARDEAHGFFQSLGYDGSAKRGFIKYRREFRSASEA